MAKIFAAYLLFMIVWSVGSFMMRTGLYPGPKIWNKIMLWGTIGEPFIFYHFCREIAKYKKNTWAVTLGYVLLLVFALTNLLGGIVTNAYLDGNNFVYALGQPAVFFALVATLYQLSSVTLLLKAGLQDPATFWSNRLIYPSIGSILILVGSLLNFFPIIGQYPVDIAANLINAFLLAYAIYRYRLLNVTITIRRGLVYSILTALIGSIYALIVLAVDRALGDNNYFAIVFSIFWAALIALYFEPTKEILRTWADRVFLGSQYDYKETLRTFSQLMTSILDLDELAESTLQLVRQALQTTSAALFLVNGNGNYYLHTSIGLGDNKMTYIDKASPIVRWLTNQHEPIICRHELETRPGFQGLWQQEKKDLMSLNTEIVVGIKMQDELIGLLVLPPKSSGDLFTDDDRELVLTLANEAAVAIKNAQTYTNVRRAAVRDELTKLYNYRFFHDCLDKEIARHQENKDSLAIILMDLDLFKAYNDIYGHLFGDEALVKVGQAIAGSIRGTDVAARYGGDEFAVILPKTTVNQA
ncbi:MAG: diguanylate cyclase, partial [bacterium]